MKKKKEVGKSLLGLLLSGERRWQRLQTFRLRSMETYRVVSSAKSELNWFSPSPPISYRPSRRVECQKRSELDWFSASSPISYRPSRLVLNLFLIVRRVPVPLSVPPFLLDSFYFYCNYYIAVCIICRKRDATHGITPSLLCLKQLCRIR
jgi:hypothetical protein